MSPTGEEGEEGEVGRAVALVRAVCLDLPGVTERLSHGAPAFFVGPQGSPKGNPKGKQFLALWPDGHHGDVFPHLWCAAPPGVQDELLAADPDRCFRPAYVGGRGWIGVRLDRDVAERELRSICEDAFRTVAPPGLVEALDASRS